MRIFQDTFEAIKRSFISVFSICMTVPLTLLKADFVDSYMCILQPSELGKVLRQKPKFTSAKHQFGSAVFYTLDSLNSLNYQFQELACVK